MTDLIDRIKEEIDTDLRLAKGEDEQEHSERHWPERVERQAAVFAGWLAEHEGVHRCDWGDHKGEYLGPCWMVRDLGRIYGIEADDD